MSSHLFIGAQDHRPESTEGSCDGCGVLGLILLTAAGEWLCYSCLRGSVDPSQEFTHV